MEWVFFFRRTPSEIRLSEITGEVLWGYFPSYKLDKAVIGISCVTRVTVYLAIQMPDFYASDDGGLTKKWIGDKIDEQGPIP